MVIVNKKNKGLENQALLYRYSKYQLLDYRISCGSH